MERKASSPLSLLSTADGSSTLFNADYQATYHSTKGALAESEYVFIKQGLHFYFETQKHAVKILEYGFGTGLNALLSIAEAKKFGYALEYWGLEILPLPQELFSVLTFGNEADTAVLQHLHTCKWDELQVLSETILFKKCKVDFQHFTSSAKFDIIYYDAFAPANQPDLWTLENMQKVLSHLSQNGFLVTYCANGAFRRNLKQAGFKVENLPGPPGKREMTRIWL